jgi:hypothetical protein
MKKRMINTTRIEGILYQHSLELKVSGPNSKKPGTEFITGTVEVATNDKMTNIVPVHYTYITATTSTGKEDARFTTLKSIIDKKVGWYTDPDVGANAAKVRIDSAIGLNEFYSDRSGTTELVSVPRNEGGFIHIVQSISENEKQRSTFETDMVIVGARTMEATETRPEKVIVDGRVFDFRGAILPVKFSAISESAMNYFLNLEASPKTPVFTKVKGQIVSEQVVRQIKEESAFGEDSVREVQSSNRDFVITWAAVEPYEFGLEETITFEDLKTAAQARENMLAELKQRNDDYKASRTQGPSAINQTSKPTAPKDESYDF